MITFAGLYNFFDGAAPRVFKGTRILGAPLTALFLLLGISPSSNGGGLTSVISKPKIEFGERTRLEFHLPIAELGLAKYDDESELPILNDDLVMESKHILVLQRDFRREKDVLIWTFDVTSYEKGQVFVPPVEIRFGAHTFSSDAAPLEVVSTRKPEDKTLRPDLGPASYPIEWTYWISMGSALLLAALFFYWARRNGLWPRLFGRLRERATFAKNEEIAETWLKRELIRLRGRLLLPHAPPPLVDDFTAILRGFFRRKTKIPAESWTTAELKKRMPEGTLPSVVLPVLSKADAWKFSGDTS